MFGPSSCAVFVLLGLASITPDGHAKDLPPFVKTCKANSEDLSGCFKESVIALRPYLAKGIPEMGLPPVEPLEIPEIGLNTGTGGAVSMDATLYKAQIGGGSNFELRQMVANLKESTGEWYMEIYFPVITLDSDYKAKGKLLLVQFDGEGKAKGEFGGVLLKGNFTGSRVMKHGKEHFKIDADHNIVVGVEKIKLNLGNLFKDNKELNDNLNKVIDENIDTLAEDVKPVVGETIRSLFLRFVNQVYNKFPIEVLYPSD